MVTTSENIKANAQNNDNTADIRPKVKHDEWYIKSNYIIHA